MSRMKTCPRCKESKPLTGEHYFRNKNKASGFNGPCKPCSAEINKEYYWRTVEARRASALNRYHKDRTAALEKYSNGSICCACCGELEVVFLCLDHIGGGGNKHRKEVPAQYLYRWLRQNNYPSGFRLLCYNCNNAVRWGPCPHESERQDEEGN